MQSSLSLPRSFTQSVLCFASSPLLPSRFFLLFIFRVKRAAFTGLRRLPRAFLHSISCATSRCVLFSFFIRKHGTHEATTAATTQAQWEQRQRLLVALFPCCGRRRRTSAATLVELTSREPNSKRYNAGNIRYRGSSAHFREDRQQGFYSVRAAATADALPRRRRTIHL